MKNKVNKKKASEMESAGRDAHADSSSESSRESDVVSDEETTVKPQNARKLETQNISKLISILKVGKQSERENALRKMLAFDLSSTECLIAIAECDGIEFLVRLLSPKFPDCHVGALRVLTQITKKPKMRKDITDFGGVDFLIKMLSSSDREIISLAAETISYLAKYRAALRTLRDGGSIVKLLDLLRSIPLSTLGQADVDAVRCAALALRSISRCIKCKEIIRQSGGVPVLVRLLRSSQEDLLTPVVETLEECMTKDMIHSGFKFEGMLTKIVKLLETSGDKLQLSCTNLIAKCAEDRRVRDLLRKQGALQPLVDLMGRLDNKKLLVAAVGAIWKCSLSEENIVKLDEYQTLEKLLELLVNQPDDVLINILGALSEFAKYPHHRTTIRTTGAIPCLMNMMKRFNTDLLASVLKVLGPLSAEPESLKIMQSLDVLKRLGFLLTKSTPQTQASAAWTICSLIDSTGDIKVFDEILSSDNGIRTLIQLLKSTSTAVVAGVCSILCRLAKNKTNLLMLSGLGVIRTLSRLAETKDDHLRRYLAEVITACCTTATNQAFFREFGGLPSLIKFLKSEDPTVRRTTVKALFHLSEDKDNCVIMSQMNTMELLLDAEESSDEELKQMATKCVSRIKTAAGCSGTSKKIRKK